MLNVGVLYGGRSGEHDVSCCSGASVFSNLDRTKYEPIAIGIDRDGRWYPQENPIFVDDPAFGRILSIEKNGHWLVNHYPENGKLVLRDIESGKSVSIDLVFPVIHGTYCEDGTLQGLLELAGVPYVGSGVLGSSVGMDKDMAKRVLKEAGIPVVPWFTVNSVDVESGFDFLAEEVELEIGYPCFVKPANAGSSVGVSKVKDESSLKGALIDAFQYDTKVMIEKGVECREIECAVLGNSFPVSSVLGEIVPVHEFYSYEAKYIDSNGANTAIPAKISTDLSAEMRDCAERAYEALALEGLARVDFFLDRKNDEYFLNEVNTLPGFTSISMYPKLWAESGTDYPALLDRLIDLALERNAARCALKVDFTTEVKA